MKPDIYRQWIEKSSIRTASLPYQSFISNIDDIVLPESSVPYITADLIPDPEVRRNLNILALCSYLRFTIELELEHIVAPLNQALFRDRSIVLPAGAVGNVLLLMCDEIFHAKFCVDLLDQAENSLDTRYRHLSRAPRSLRRIGDLIEREDGGVARALRQFYFIVISETLITTNLGAIRNSPSAAAVRSVLEAHARDEFRHCSFVVELWRSISAGLSAAEARTLKRLGAEMIELYLAPDIDLVHDMLTGVGLTEEDAQSVIRRSLPPDRVAALVRRSSSNTRKLLGIELVRG